MVSGHCRVGSPPVLLIVVLLSSLLTSVAPDLDGDATALLALLAAVGSPRRLNWTAAVSPCNWPGVACEGNRVSSLRIPGSGLVGQIPTGTVGNLTALRVLSLRYNRLSALPADLAGAAQLRTLYLQNNQLSGEIPRSILSLPRLVRLNLASNSFTGAIPPGFRNLSRLAMLYLQNNSLSGEIPDLATRKLVQFNVSYNQLNGSIPPSLQSWPATAFLGLSVCGGPLGPCSNAPAPALSPPPAGGPAAAGGGNGTGNGNESSSNKLSGGAIAGIAIGSAAALLIAVILLVLLCRKKSRNTTVQTVAKPPEVGTGVTDGANGNGGGSNSAPAPGAAVAAAGAGAAAAAAKKLVFFGGGERPFDLEDLLRASAEVLGKGTFGTAYKAVMETGTVVAVKRLKDVTMQEREFRERIEVVGSMVHPNIVPLRAYYFSKDEKLLVYDYMSRGSLSALLHGNRAAGRTPLDWEARSSIASSAARGIEYIHSTSPSASHGNIKSSNILLEKSFDARVSDHGLAQIAGSTSSPNRIAGYRAPEVTDLHKVSQKADVYSFGVLLLELLTAKAPQQALLNEEGVDLPRWVQSVVREEWTSEVFDPELLRNQNTELQMVELLQLAVDCAAQYPDRRPSMSQVVTRIDEIRRSSNQAAGQDHGQIHQIEEAVG